MTSVVTTLYFDIGINTLWPHEKLTGGDRRWKRYNASFHKRTTDIAGLAALLTQGYGFTPVMKNSYRMQANFISGQHVAVDFDTNDERSSFATLLARPFIQQYAAILYTTPSHTPEGPRARVVFIFDQPVTDKDEYGRLAKAIVGLFGESDPTVAESARLFFGSGKRGQVLTLGKILPLAFARTLSPPAPPEGSYYPRPYAPRQGRLYHVSGVRPHHTVTELINKYAPRIIQNGSNPRSHWVLRCPLCTEYVEAEARSFTIAADDNVWKCFACLKFGNAYELHVALAPEEFSPNRQPRPGRNRPDPDGPDIPPQEPSDWNLLTRALPTEEPSDFDWESYVVPRSVHDDQYKGRRVKLVATYRTLGEHLKANKLSHCTVDLRCRLWANGNEDLCPYHCGVVGCPNDIGRNVYLLLKEKREKLNLLVQPAVYVAENVLTLAWPKDDDEQVMVLKLGHRSVHKLLDLWSARLPNSALIRNCIQAFCSRIIESPVGRIVTFGLTLLANWSERNQEMMTKALSHRTPKLNQELAQYVAPVEALSLRVVEHPFRFPSQPGGTDHLDAAIEMFHRRAAAPFDWDDPEDFAVWAKAMRGVKKVQGRGAFRAVTGNKPTGLAPTADVNWATGEMDTFTWYKGKVYKRDVTEPFRSERTGKTYLVFRAGYTKENCGVDPAAMPEDQPGGGDLGP